MFDHVTVMDWIKAAAFIDGEGSIYISLSKQRKSLSGHRLCLDITNTDPRLPLWFKEKFGGSVRNHSNKPGPNSRRAYRWVTASEKAANVIYGCLPHFLLKREQAEIALAFQETLTGRGGRYNTVSQESFAERESYRLQISEAKWIEHEWPKSIATN